MQTITEVSRQLDVSTRMLRYYEQQGLIRSCRRADYAWRTYDAENVARLRVLLVLRRLRVPLKDIAALLNRCDAQQAVEVLQGRIREVEREIHAMEAIREALRLFVECIGAAGDVQSRAALLEDEKLLHAINALGLNQSSLKERIIMNQVNQAEQEMWQKINPRLVVLPPMTVAAFHYVGAECEDHAQAMAGQFIRDSGLYTLKPDSRMFGFNHPNPTPEQPIYGYEYWVSIPDDMEVPAPGQKKHFPGGVYAAHSMEFPNFHEWQWLSDWVDHNPEWCSRCDPDGGSHMFGLLEEHLNWVWALSQAQMDESLTRRLDLLLPIAGRNVTLHPARD